MSLIPHSLNTKMNEDLAFWLVQLPFLSNKAFEYSSTQGLLQLQIHGSKDLNVVHMLKSALISTRKNPVSWVWLFFPRAKSQKRYLEVEDTDLNLSWLLRHLRNNEIWIVPPQPIAQALLFSFLWQDQSLLRETHAVPLNLVPPTHINTVTAVWERICSWFLDVICHSLLMIFIIITCCILETDRAHVGSFT